MGPGTDFLVTCAGHDGRQFAPTTYIINGTTGAIVSTINFVGGVDQGWYNPGDGNYYEAARDMLPSPVLGVIDAEYEGNGSKTCPRTATRTALRPISTTITSSCLCPPEAIASRKLPMVA